MRSEREILNALSGQYEKGQQSALRTTAYEELFLKESALYLLQELKSREDRAGCAAVLDGYLQEQGAQHLAARLAQALCLQARAQGMKLLALHETARSLQSICYVKSRFTEQALDCLEKEISVFYADSFEDACEQVIDRRKDGCLLPYMGKDRQPLPGVARLIDEYGLKKCRMIEIENEDQSTVYLLLSARLCPEKQADRMEWMLCANRQERLWQLLSLGRELGLSMSFPVSLRASSEIPSREEPLFCRLTARAPLPLLKDFEEIMALCLPESEVMGLYAHRYIGG